MRESGYPVIVGLFSTALVLFGGSLPHPDGCADTATRQRAHRADAFDPPRRADDPLYDHRLLLVHPFLQAALLVRTPRCRATLTDCVSEFTRPWWTWMILTGVFLSLTISCKMVGLFAFMTVGAAVLVDLWNLLDVRRGHTLVCPLDDLLPLTPRRNTSRGTLRRVWSDCSSFRRSCTSSGSGCTLPCSPRPARETSSCPLRSSRRSLARL